MAHHKNRKPRQDRNNHTGCCKRQKANCNRNTPEWRTIQERRALEAERLGFNDYESSAAQRSDERACSVVVEDVEVIE